MTDSAYGRPLVIPNGEAPLEVRRVSLTATTNKGGYDEKYIQELAFRYPDCLPVTEIDRAYEGIVPICMELGTSAGYLDGLYITPTGRLVILEAKLWRNPEARRKVVGQILDYARELATWTFAELQGAVGQNLKKKGNVLFDLVSSVHPDLDEAAFVDGVQQSLRNGQFLLMILGDGIREGAATITAFLEKHASLEFTFGLVELALFRTEREELLVLPRVLAQSVILNRMIVSLADGMELVEPAVAEEKPSSVSGVLSESHEFYLKFWSEFTSHLELDEQDQPVPNTTKIENLYFALPPSGSVSWVSAFFSRSASCVGVYLTFGRGTFGDIAYEKLLASKVQIDKELGLGVDWESQNGKHKIVIRKKYVDVWSAKERPDIQLFLSEYVNKFVNSFRPRLSDIAEDLKG